MTDEIKSIKVSIEVEFDRKNFLSTGSTVFRFAGDEANIFLEGIQILRTRFEEERHKLAPETEIPVDDCHEEVCACRERLSQESF